MGFKLPLYKIPLFSIILSAINSQKQKMCFPNNGQKMNHASSEFEGKSESELKNLSSCVIGFPPNGEFVYAQ
jgi:hypothetical protein